MREFKSGDRVVCIPGFLQEPSIYPANNDPRYGGSGYKPGRQFIVSRVEEDVLWPYPDTFPNNHGVYKRACKLDEIYYIENSIKEELGL